MKPLNNFARYEFLAKRFLKTGRLPSLLMSVARKREGLGSGFTDIKEHLKLFQSLCVAWIKGEYRAIKPQAFLSVIAALLYFVSPLDAVPDWLLGVGFVDDLAVLAWVLKKWSGELSAFKQWRDAQPPQIRQTLEHIPDSQTP
ncbi:DUF1232 domain-containing protein [Ectopseudomonas mendocina]|uniref:DUF1232 domain-containing protein n=1 Tax=Ectopseudomonas mendocina TaxID=300 RepID=A0ABZ2RQ64_ECTME